MGRRLPGHLRHRTKGVCRPAGLAFLSLTHSWVYLTSPTNPLSPNTAHLTNPTPVSQSRLTNPPSQGITLQWLRPACCCLGTRLPCTYMPVKCLHSQHASPSPPSPSKLKFITTLGGRVKVRQLWARGGNLRSFFFFFWTGFGSWWSLHFVGGRI